MVFITKLLKKLAYDTKVSHKLLLVIMGMVVIPVICLGLLFYRRFENVIKAEIGNSYEQVVNQYTNNIDYKLSIYKNLLENIVLNGTIQKTLTDQENNGASDVLTSKGPITSEVDSLIYGINQNEIHSLKLYTYSDVSPIDRRYVSNLNSIKDQPWYDNLIRSTDKMQYFFYTTEGLNRQLIAFVKSITRINGSWNTLGFIKLDIDLKYMFDTSKILSQVNCDSILIFDGKGHIVTSSTPDDKNTADIWNLYIRSKQANGNGLLMYNGQKHIVAYRNIGEYGWTVFFVFPYSEIGEKVKEAAYPIFTVSAILLAVLLSLTVLFSYFFSGRIGRLIKKMVKVEKGNLEISDKIQGKDEIGTVDAHFNRMVERLGGLINENYIQQLERRDAELNALQAQINPHFLYNTFEAINSIASIYGSEEICTISQNLGEMFRYSINIGRHEFVSLEDEIQHIRNYISIQMIRYNNCFEVEYLIPEELYRCKILKFILQPLVENSFIHGFKGSKKGGRIIISAARQEDRLEFYIEDNGKGMNMEQLSELEAYLNEKSSPVITTEKRSIGVRNVNSRIKLAYGENFGLYFKSVENQGTKVTAVLPYIT